MSSITQSETISKWAAHKKAAESVAKKLLKSSPAYASRSARMLSCGDTIGAAYCPTCGTYHVQHSHQCRDRLCPLCSWRLSIKRYYEMKEVLEYLRPQLESRRVAMLTLTVKNVKAAQLRACLVDMSKAWKRLQQSKAYKSVWGWARCMEITYNQKTKSFHPHMHILTIIDEGAESTATMMKQLKAGWQAAARLPYSPIIDLREAYTKDKREDVIACAGEAFAYSIKPATTAAIPHTQIGSFAAAISGHRLVSYGGAIKEARAALGMTDTEEVEEHEKNICKCGNQLEYITLVWSAGGYERLEEVRP